MADATAADPPPVSAAAAIPAPAATAVDGVTKAAAAAAAAAAAPAPHAPPAASGPGRLPLPGLRRKPPPVTIPNVNDGTWRRPRAGLLSAAARD